MKKCMPGLGCQLLYSATVLSRYCAVRLNFFYILLFTYILFVWKVLYTYCHRKVCGAQLLAAQNQVNRPGWWKGKFASKGGVNRTWTVNFQMFKLVLEKAEEPEIKLPTSAGSWKKQESSRKTSISALLTMPKPLTVWVTINCGKFFKRWEYQTNRPASSEIYM